MKCPFCQHDDTRVIDSRTSDDQSVVRRRRECPECSRRFTTYERPGEVRIFVIKKDGRREPFDRNKVIAGMTKACEKRPISREAIEQAVDGVERAVRDQLAEEMPTSEIGALVMQALREMDEVAYVRFASVYKEFRDADSFLKEIESLVRKTPSAATGEGPRGSAPSHRTTGHNT
jgi:transcriptional repressor NrdR